MAASNGAEDVLFHLRTFLGRKVGKQLLTWIFRARSTDASTPPLNTLKGLVQAPHVTKELHNDAEREVGGRNARRSHHVQESQTLVHVLPLRTNVYL